MWASILKGEVNFITRWIEVLKVSRLLIELKIPLQN